VLGVLLAMLYERTGSLWMPLALHYCFNALTVGVQLLVKLKPELLEDAGNNAAALGIW
jgi:membrane protease YdiL (CAAX protease family)